RRPARGSSRRRSPRGRRPRGRWRRPSPRPPMAGVRRSSVRWERCRSGAGCSSRQTTWCRARTRHYGPRVEGQGPRQSRAPRPLGRRGSPHRGAQIPRPEPCPSHDRRDMTSSDLTTSARSARPGDVTPGAAARAAAVPGVVAAPEIVAAVTGALPVVTTVTAVVVTRGRTPFLARTLEALRTQTTSPHEVVVVDAAAGDASSEHQGLQLGDARFVAAPRARSFGDAVDVALGNVDPGTWLWLLHDDSAPAPDALAELLRAVEHS